MSPDLRVAGSMFCNALEALKAVEGCSNDLDSMRKLPRVMDDFRKRCDELLPVLDREIEGAVEELSGVHAVQQQNVRGVYKVQPEKMAALVELVAEWVTTFDETDAAENAPRELWGRLEAAELGLRAFLDHARTACRRASDARPSREEHKPRLPGTPEPRCIVAGTAEHTLRPPRAPAPRRLPRVQVTERPRSPFYSPPID